MLVDLSVLPSTLIGGSCLSNGGGLVIRQGYVGEWSRHPTHDRASADIRRRLTVLKELGGREKDQTVHISRLDRIDYLVLRL